MSGRVSTITITEEEYRRLYEADMKQRFGREADPFRGKYQQHLRALNRQIADLQSQLDQAKISKSSDAALHQRLQIASRLIWALKQAGYRQVGYDFTDSTRRETALLRLERASDGSRVTLAVGQNPDLFWARDTGEEKYSFGADQIINHLPQTENAPDDDSRAQKGEPR